MIRALPTQQIRRLPWLAAALVLLAMRLVSPAGFMPDWKAATFALQACDGVAAMPAAHEHGHRGHHQPKQPSSHQQPCPFAVAAAHAGVAPVDAARIDPPIEVEALPPTFALPASAPQQHRERPKARGPPAVA